MNEIEEFEDSMRLIKKNFERADAYRILVDIALSRNKL